MTKWKIDTAFGMSIVEAENREEAKSIALSQLASYINSISLATDDDIAWYDAMRQGPKPKRETQKCCGDDGCKCGD